MVSDSIAHFDRTQEESRAEGIGLGVVGGALEVLGVRGGMDLESEALDNLGGDVTARCKERACGSEMDGAGVPAVSSRRMATESDGIGGATLLNKVRVAPEVCETTRTIWRFVPRGARGKAETGGESFRERATGPGS